MFGYEAIVFVMGLSAGLIAAWTVWWWCFKGDSDD